MAVIVLVLLGGLVPEVMEGVKASCSARILGNTGSVTCKFSEDLSIQKYSFKAQHLDLSSNHKPDRVLDCIWARSGRLSCNVHDGYVLDKNVSDIVTVSIPELSEDHEGRYKCQVVPSSVGDEVTSCDLNIQEKSTTAESATRASVALARYPGLKQQETRKRDENTVSIALSATAVIGTVFLALTILFWLLKSRWRFCSSRSSQIKLSKTGQPKSNGEKDTNREEAVRMIPH